MSITETVLVFGGIPAAVVLVIYGAVYAGGAQRSRRYRPGRPFEFRPVWFLSAPELSAPELSAPELSAPERAAVGTAASAVDSPPQHGLTGGASDSW